MPVLPDGTIVDERGNPTGQRVNLQTGQVSGALITAPPPTAVTELQKAQELQARTNKFLAQQGLPQVPVPGGLSPEIARRLNLEEGFRPEELAPTGEPIDIERLPSRDIFDEEPKEDRFGEALKRIQERIEAPQVPRIKEITQSVLEQLGVPEARTRIDTLTKEIEGLEVERGNKIAQINDNPWLDEAQRKGRVQNIQDEFERKIGARVNKLRLFQGALEDARQEAQFVVREALDIFTQERALGERQFEKLLERVEEEEKSRRELIEAGEPLEEETIGGFRVLRGARTGKIRATKELAETQSETERAFFRQFGRLPNISELLQYRPSILLQTGAIDRQLTPTEAGDFGVPFGTLASEVKGVIPLGDAARKQLSTKASAIATLGEIEKISTRVNTFGPGFLGINRLIEGGQLGVGAITQTNPDAAQLIAQKGILATIIRGLGEVGTLATADVDRALALIPGLTTTEAVAKANLKEIRTILESAKEAVVTGAQIQIRPQTKKGFSGVSPSGLRYKVTQ